MKKKIVLLVVCMTLLSWVKAQVILPSVYGNNSVLKQNSTVNMSGWAPPGSLVNVVASWNLKDTVKVKVANSGKFQTQLKTPNGSYTNHTIWFNNQPLMTNILIGEVWLCSGQSNMEWSVNNGIADGAQHAKEANHPNLRIFQIPKHTAETPQEDCKFTQWVSCTPQSMKITSAVGYFFGRELMEKLDVPVGIIVSAWGGASAEAWTPEELIYNDSILSGSITTGSNYTKDDRPGKMYNAMIAPILSYQLSGIIWYQGESNVSKHYVYSHLIHTMIKGWQERFRQDMPFYMAQIAPYTYSKNNKSGAAELREAQAKVARENKGIELVVLPDLVNDVRNIHPLDKLTVGKRFANIALSEVYGVEGLIYRYPEVDNINVTKNSATISFNYADKGLKIGSIQGSKTLKEIVGLEIVDEHGVVYPGVGKIRGSKLEVFAKDKSGKAIKNIASVRYCYDDATIGNLFNTDGMPVIPFNAKVTLN